MTSISEAVSKNIRFARKAASLRQVDLAELLGVSEKTVIDWEKGHKDPLNKHLENMAQKLGLPNGRWFFREPDGEKSEAVVISRDWARRLTDVYRGIAALNPAAPPLPHFLTQMQELSETCPTMPAIAEVRDLTSYVEEMLTKEAPEEPGEPEFLTSVAHSIPPEDLSRLQFLAPF